MGKYRAWDQQGVRQYLENPTWRYSCSKREPNITGISFEKLPTCSANTYLITQGNLTMLQSGLCTLSSAQKTRPSSNSARFVMKEKKVESPCCAMQRSGSCEVALDLLFS